MIFSLIEQPFQNFSIAPFQYHPLIETQVLWAVSSISLTNMAKKEETKQINYLLHIFGVEVKYLILTNEN